MCNKDKTTSWVTLKDVDCDKKCKECPLHPSEENNHTTCRERHFADLDGRILQIRKIIHSDGRNIEKEYRIHPGYEWHPLNSISNIHMVGIPIRNCFGVTCKECPLYKSHGSASCPSDNKDKNGNSYEHRLKMNEDGKAISVFRIIKNEEWHLIKGISTCCGFLTCRMCPISSKVLKCSMGCNYRDYKDLEGRKWEFRIVDNKPEFRIYEEKQNYNLFKERIQRHIDSRLLMNAEIVGNYSNTDRILEDKCPICYASLPESLVLDILYNRIDCPHCGYRPSRCVYKGCRGLTYDRYLSSGEMIRVCQDCGNEQPKI